VEGREREGALTGGPARFKINSIHFKPIQTHSNLLRSKQDLAVLQKFEIKYGWKGLEIRNNFPYRDLLRFELHLELKFREVCMP
jgi:hypothetical protein